MSTHEGSAWFSELSECISAVIAMRPPNPTAALAAMLAKPPNWSESSERYAERHGLAEKVTRALDEAGIVPGQPQPPDTLKRLASILASSSDHALMQPLPASDPPRKSRELQELHVGSAAAKRKRDRIRGS